MKSFLTLCYSLMPVYEIPRGGHVHFLSTALEISYAVSWDTKDEFAPHARHPSAECWDGWGLYYLFVLISSNNNRPEGERGADLLFSFFHRLVLALGESFQLASILRQHKRRSKWRAYPLCHNIDRSSLTPPKWTSRATWGNVCRVLDKHEIGNMFLWWMEYFHCPIKARDAQG